MNILKCLKATILISMAFTCTILNGQYTKLFDFSDSAGSFPQGSPILSDSILYGTTQGGGINYAGTVFSINIDGSAYRKIHEFNISDGAAPNTQLILKNNELFGVTRIGGSSEGDSGVIYRVNIDGTGFKTIHEFNSVNGSSPDYCTPILVGNFLYGLTTSGGNNNNGTLYKVDTNGTGFEVLRHFDYANGFSPKGALVIKGDTLFGITTLGNSKGFGSIFRIKTDGTEFTVLHEFDQTSSGEPSSLSISEDYLYGMTVDKIYKIRVDGTNYKTLLDFDMLNGYYPYSCSLNIVDSMIYGLTFYGGDTYFSGVIFRLDTNGENYQRLHRFNGSDGRNPCGSIIVSNKVLYGITMQGGNNDMGVLYKLVLCKDTVMVNDASIAINGEFELPDGTVVKNPGTYTNMFASIYGCDSTIVTHLTILTCKDTTMIQYVEIANNASYILPDGEIAESAGTYLSKFSSTQGCDSTYVTHVTELNCSNTSVIVYIYVQGAGSHTLPGGEIVSSPGTYIDTLKSINGCDSVITTNLSFITSVDEDIDKAEISIYPNPASDYVYIITSLNKLKLSIFDIYGNLIMFKELENNINHLNVNNLKEGLFIIRFDYQNKSKMIKLIKTD